MLRKPPPSAVLASAPPKDDARKLAEWTRLDMDLLKALYASLSRKVPGLPNVNVASTDPVPDNDVHEEPLRTILALCRAAQRASVLGELCISIVGVEQEIKGRLAAEVDEILKSIGYAGEPQGVTNRARGKAHPRIFYKLAKIFEATAYIEDQTGFRGTGFLVDRDGTGFLVDRDVVLTAAHVALECNIDAQGTVIFAPRARAGLRVVFPETPGGQQSANLDAMTPVLACAEPYTNSSGKLVKDVTKEAAGKLDFALLLLDRQIVGVEPLSMEGLDQPSIGPLSFVIGYPGGTSPAFDADSFVRPEPLGRRVIHMMNAQPGMSGSCCTGDGGIPVGIHEGELPVLDANLQPAKNPDGSEKKENRAVLLRAIAQHIRARVPEALDRRRNAPGIAIFDRELVHRLGKRGQQLADEATRARWEKMFAETVGVSPSEPSGTWTIHPWFARDQKRRQLGSWFKDAANPKAGQRVIFISGPDGCGKTFSIDILGALLATPSLDLFRVEGIAESKSLDRVATQLPRFVASTITRTAEGRVKYDTVEDMVDALSRVGGRDRAKDRTAHPLFVAIDAGHAADALIAATEWVHLVIALAAQPWARLVICGLALETEQRFTDALAADQATRRLDPDLVALDHVTATDIAAFLDAYGRLDGKPFEKSAADDLAKSFEDPKLLHATCTPLTTAEAALMSVALLKATG